MRPVRGFPEKKRRHGNNFLYCSPLAETLEEVECELRLSAGKFLSSRVFESTKEGQPKTMEGQHSFGAAASRRHLAASGRDAAVELVALLKRKMTTSRVWGDES